MTKPNIKVDWTINVSSIFGALLFLLGCVGSWYNLKQEVAVNKATSEVKFSQLDSSIADVRVQIDKQVDVIRSDVRDLHRDINALAQPPRGQTPRQLTTGTQKDEPGR